MGKTKFQKAVMVYKVYYMLYLLFAFNAFINGQKMMQYATYVTAVVGAVLVLWMLKDYKQYLKMKNLILLGLFLFSYCVSSALNIQYGVEENIQEVIWLGLQIFILYLLSYRYTSEMMKQELKILSIVTVVYCTIANLISFTMLKWGYLYDYVDPTGYAHGIGYRWGRLWGVYDDPNHGAVITVIAIILATYLCTQYKKSAVRILLGISMAIQYIYIGFADSRTASFALCGAVLTGVFFVGNCMAKKWSGVKKYAANLLIALVVTGICMGGILTGEKVNEEMSKKAQETAQVKKEVTVKQANPTGRKRDLAKDSSNGRFDIWMSGVEIAKTSPIYGVSFRNMTVYAKENLPKTYIVNNSLVAYDSLHNVFVDVLVSQGMIGMVIVLAFIVNTVRTLCLGVKGYQKSDYALLVTCLALVAAMAVASMFYSYVFYLHAPQTYIFWLGLGYLITLAQKNDHKTGK